MTGLLRVINAAEKTGAFLAALSIALLFFLGLAEIVLRTLVGYSLPISLEYSGYLVAFSFFLGLGWTLAQEKHIHLSLIESKLGPEGSACWFRDRLHGRHDLDSPRRRRRRTRPVLELVRPSAHGVPASPRADERRSHR